MVSTESETKLCWMYEYFRFIVAFWCSYFLVSWWIRLDEWWVCSVYVYSVIVDVMNMMQCRLVSERNEQSSSGEPSSTWKCVLCSHFDSFHSIFLKAGNHLNILFFFGWRFFFVVRCWGFCRSLFGQLSLVLFPLSRFVIFVLFKYRNMLEEWQFFWCQMK